MSTAVVSLQDQIKAELAGIRKTLPAPSRTSISIKDKIWTLPDGTTSRAPLSVVILDHRNYNRYYKRIYNPNNPELPSCFAIGKDTENLGPRPSAKEPQSELCAPCIHNQWGSAGNGRKGKACRNMVKLAVARPDSGENAPIFTLMVPPTSLGNWGAHISELENNGLLPIQVVTRISFDANVSHPKLIFEVDRPHDRLELMWALRERAQALLEEEPTED